MCLLFFSVHAFFFFFFFFFGSFVRSSGIYTHMLMTSYFLLMYLKRRAKEGGEEGEGGKVSVIFAFLTFCSLLTCFFLHHGAMVGFMIRKWHEWIWEEEGTVFFLHRSGWIVVQLCEE